MSHFRGRRGADRRCRRALLAVATTTLALTPATAFAATTLPAENFTVSPTTAGAARTDSAATDGRALRLWANAPATGTATTGTKATTLTLRARGEQCSGAPHVAVSIDGAKLLTATVSNTTYTTYTATIALAAGTH